MTNRQYRQVWTALNFIMWLMVFIVASTTGDTNMLIAFSAAAIACHGVARTFPRNDELPS